MLVLGWGRNIEMIADLVGRESEPQMYVWM